MKSIIVGEKCIGTDNAPFIVAEMSANHNKSLERALSIVEAAAEAGADAIKLQTYTSDRMTLNLNKKEFYINNANSLWNGKSLYELYQDAYTPREWHKVIFEKCNDLGLICFSSPLDYTDVDFLEEIGMPLYKVGGFDNIDLPLIRYLSETGKPIIISTGMATLGELYDIVNTALESGCKDLVLLKCTSTYPALPKNANLLTIPHMKEMFDVHVGLSDHTLSNGVAIASVALGATVIEKHFTLSRMDPSPDSMFSVEPEELETLVKETKKAWQSLGMIHYGPTDEEKEYLKYRRSLYVTMDMKPGDIFTKENLKAIRPGYGLPIKYYNIFLGKKVNEEVAKGTPLNWDMIG